MKYKKRWQWVWFSVVCLLLVASVGFSAPLEKQVYQRVIIIGLDGAGNFVQQAKAPHLKRFFSTGTVTYQAQAVSPTWSAQNWGSLLHGVLPEKHGLNNFKVEIQRYPEDSPYPSLLKLYQQAKPGAKMASMCSWKGINYGIIEKSVRAHKVTLEDGELVGKVTDYIRTQGKETEITMIHLGDIDHVGHNQGWETEAYYQQYTKTDKHVGMILQVIKEARLLDDSLIIITTDHGGKGNGHGGESAKEKQVFWAAAGKGIKPGSKLEASITNMDTAAVVAKALGLTRPNNWDAKVPAGIFH